MFYFPFETVKPKVKSENITPCDIKDNGKVLVKRLNTINQE